MMEVVSDNKHENDAEHKIAELMRANGILKANISTLYRTARAEIARKDERIRDLQAELDDLIFRRLDKKLESEEKKVSKE